MANAIDRLQIRRDNAAQWVSINPILKDGEIALERDTGRLKVGNGVTPWTSLPYVSPGEQGPMGPQGPATLVEDPADPGFYLTGGV